MDIKKHFKKNWQTYLIIGLLLVLIGNFFTYRPFHSDSENILGISKSYYRDSISNYKSSYYDGEADEKKITTANINLESENYFNAKNSILNSIKAKEGIILNENEYEDNKGNKNIYINAKVPSNKLNLLLEELKNLAEVKSLNIIIDDVTKSYIDYSDRLNRYKEQIEKYKNMLKRNITVEDEIKIQNRIDQLEDQIFYLKKRVSEIDNDVEYSTLYISLKEKPSILENIDFLGFKDSIKLFLNSLDSAFRLIVGLIGFLLPFGIIYLVYKLIKKFSKKNRN